MLPTHITGDVVGDDDSEVGVASEEVTSGLPLQQTSASPNKNSVIGNAPRQNNMHDASGRIIKSILLHKDSRQNPSTLPSEMPIQVRIQEKDKRPPRASNVQLHRKDTNEAAEDRTAGNDIQGFYTEKPEKRTRNKDRPDRGVWTPLLRSDGLHASNDSKLELKQQLYYWRWREFRRPTIAIPVIRWLLLLYS
ncbi:hypothetical protein POM88_040977 [Heracleum sosnowskyi]|uniref:Uncharacterized protein n=1 Tax=Heracleum sosnowskyi TaxID=360622 RepID=A0AAD8M9A7_9APIA|nr:hypothetical protein POM88_040977 [Heracleum sosnowskyi]